jgi:hypothetical protein
MFNAFSAFWLYDTLRRSIDSRAAVNTALTCHSIPG